MRSRYSAFALASRSPQAIDHLLRTHPEPGRDPRQRRRELQVSTRGVQWLGLSVRATEAGGPQDATGTVTFEARWRSRSGEAGVMRECSRFGRGPAGEWLYLEPISEPIS